MSSFPFPLSSQSHYTYTSPQDQSLLSVQERISKACTNAAIEALKNIEVSKDQNRRVPTLYQLCVHRLINDNLHHVDTDHAANILATSKLLLDDNLHQAYLNPLSTKLLLDSAYFPTPEHCKDIESIDLQELSINSKELSEETLFKLFSLCQNLRHVNMSGSKLGWKASFMKEGPRKTYMQLGWVPSLSNQCLEAIAANNPSLQHLNLGGGENVRDSGIRSITDQCSDLTHLDLRSCQHLSGEALFSLSRVSSKLENLNVDWIKQLTSNSLIALADNAASLQVFSARSCEGLGDAGIQAILSQCPKLTFLDLSYCLSISDACLPFMQATELKHVNVSGCHQLSDSSLSLLKASVHNVITGRERCLL
ncbi:MAG: hypothetical protein ACI8RA_002390 [Chlamydiales bacterium]|jgi:hypothetical protein